MAAQIPTIAPYRPSPRSFLFEPWLNALAANTIDHVGTTRGTTYYCAEGATGGGLDSSDPMSLTDIRTQIALGNDNEAFLFNGGDRFYSTTGFTLNGDDVTVGGYGTGLPNLTALAPLSFLPWSTLNDHYTIGVGFPVYVIQIVGYELNNVYRCNSSAEVNDFANGTALWPFGMVAAFYSASPNLEIALNPAVTGDTDPNNFTIYTGSNTTNGVVMDGNRNILQDLWVDGYGVYPRGLASDSPDQKYPVQSIASTDRVHVVRNSFLLHGETHGPSVYVGGGAGGYCMFDNITYGLCTRSAIAPKCNNYYARDGEGEWYTRRSLCIGAAIADTLDIPPGTLEARRGQSIYAHTSAALTPLTTMLSYQNRVLDLPFNCAQGTGFAQAELTIPTKPDDCKVIVIGEDLRSTRTWNAVSTMKPRRSHFVANSRYHVKLHPDVAVNNLTAGDASEGFMYNSELLADATDRTGYFYLERFDQYNPTDNENVGPLIHCNLIDVNATGEIIYDGPWAGGSADSTDSGMIKNCLVVHQNGSTHGWEHWPAGANFRYSAMVNRGSGGSSPSTTTSSITLTGKDYDSTLGIPRPSAKNQWAALIGAGEPRVADVSVPDVFTGTPTQDASGNAAWLNLANLTTDDSSNASVTLGRNQTSHVITCSGFNFGSPTAGRVLTRLVVTLGDVLADGAAYLTVTRLIDGSADGFPTVVVAPMSKTSVEVDLTGVLTSTTDDLSSLQILISATSTDLVSNAILMDFVSVDADYQGSDFEIDYDFSGRLRTLEDVPTIGAMMAGGGSSGFRGSVGRLRSRGGR